MDRSILYRWPRYQWPPCQLPSCLIGWTGATSGRRLHTLLTTSDSLPQRLQHLTTLAQCRLIDRTRYDTGPANSDSTVLLSLDSHQRNTGRPVFGREHENVGASLNQMSKYIMVVVLIEFCPFTSLSWMTIVFQNYSSIKILKQKIAFLSKFVFCPIQTVYGR